MKKSKELENVDPEDSEAMTANAAKVVMADSVEAEEVPTIPMGSLQTIGALQPEISVHSIASSSDVSIPEPLVELPAEYHPGLGERLHLWWDGIRPAYLALPLMPLLLGSILAWTRTVSANSPLGHFNFMPFFAAIVAISLLQVGANLVNDYYDYLGGIDVSNTFGPGGLIQQGLARPTRVLVVGFALLALGALLGLFVAASGGPLVYLSGFVGLAVAYIYSATARTFSAALGEVSGFVIFGPLVVLGAYLIQRQPLTPLVFLYSLPSGLWAATVIHLNNMRDMEGDAQAGKRTLASILKLSWSRVWFLALLLSAYISVLLLAVPHGTPHLLLISLWTLPMLVVIISGVLRTDTPSGLDMALRQLLRLEISFTILLVLALMIATLFPVFSLIPAALLHL